MVLNGLKLHFSKTQALNVASFLDKSRLPLSLNLCNNIVNITNTAKYLGRLIDGDQLSCKSHINFIEKNLSRSLGIMHGLSYRLAHNALQILYFSLAHVHLIYALPVWTITFPTCSIKLKRLQIKVI